MTIPKIFFTYWEGKQLSILHYYTILSLYKLNPEQEIIIYSSEIESNILKVWDTPEQSIYINHLINLESILNINKEKIILKKINFEKDYGLNNNLSVIYKADFIRIAKLYEHGGMWFDFDILFIKSIPNYLFENKDFYYFFYYDTIPTGLLLSIPNTLFLKTLFDNALSSLKNLNISGYQTIGPNIWAYYFNQNPEYSYNSECLETSLVYAYDWLNFNLLYESLDILFTGNSFACHWYNGANETKQFINKFNDIYSGQLDENRSVIEKYIVKIKNI